MSKKNQLDKVQLIVECSIDERMYIEKLAVERHMTISELFLTSVDVMFSQPNLETANALKESRECELDSYSSLDDFWKAMGIDFKKFKRDS